MRKSMLCSFVAVMAILGLAVTCSPERRAAGPQKSAIKKTTVATMTVDIALRFTGVAHLIGDSATERLLVVPNHATATVPHLPVIIAHENFPSTTLPNVAVQAGTGHRFRWGPLTPGFSIDLANSTGFDPTLPMNQRLAMSSNGDPSVQCPNVLPGPVAAESLHWLPRLSFVSRRNGTPAVLAKYTMADPRKADVVARHVINFGRLSAEKISPRPFKFVDGASTIATQAAALFLRHDFQVVLEEDPTTKKFLFTLMGVTFRDGSTAPQPVPLGTFEAVRGRKRIEIIIANLPDQAFFNPAAHGPLSHFHDLNYAAVTGLAPTTPVVDMTVRCSGGGVGTEIECGPDRLP